MLEKIFSGGKAEQRAIEHIRQHIRTLHAACEAFREALVRNDPALMLSIAELEREGDSVRRQILSAIYEGAFLPFLRPSMCRFVEIADDAFDTLEDAAYEFEFAAPLLDQDIRDDGIRIAKMNAEMCEILLIAFDTLFSGGDLREKTLAIRIFEKKIDEIKFDIVRQLRRREVKSFWEGKALSDFVSFLTSVSDRVEDASDYLHVINLRLR